MAPLYDVMAMPISTRTAVLILGLELLAIMLLGVYCTGALGMAASGRPSITIQLQDQPSRLAPLGRTTAI